MAERNELVLQIDFLQVGLQQGGLLLYFLGPGLDEEGQ